MKVNVKDIDSNMIQRMFSGKKPHIFRKFYGNSK